MKTEVAAVGPGTFTQATEEDGCPRGTMGNWGPRAASCAPRGEAGLRKRVASSRAELSQEPEKLSPDTILRTL